MILQTQFLFNGIISYFAKQFKNFPQSRVPITPKACISSCSAGTVYHQHEVLYIIKSQGNARWRVMRYKGGSPPLMIYASLRAVMICQAYGNPQSSASSLRGTPTAAWIKKFDKLQLVEFFGAGNGTVEPASLRSTASLP